MAGFLGPALNSAGFSFGSGQSTTRFGRVCIRQFLRSRSSCVRRVLSVHGRLRE